MAQTIANQTSLEALIQKLKLGKILSPPKPFLGSELHENWYVQTSQDKFVVKKINQNSIHEVDPIYYERCETIANELYAAEIPAVGALKFNESYVQFFQNSWYLVFPHIDAECKDPDEVSDTDAKQLAALFHAVHCANIEVLESDQLDYDFFSNDYWQTLLMQTKLIDTNTQKFILDINSRYQEILPMLCENVCLSHRNIHPKNVTWQQQQPFLIGWEMAGLIDPRIEVIGFALEWAGIMQAKMHFNIAQTLVKNYQTLSEQTYNAESIYLGYIGWLGHSCLGRLELNIKRLLSGDKNQAEISKKIVTQICKVFSYLPEVEPLLLTKIVA